MEHQPLSWEHRMPLKIMVYHQFPNPTCHVGLHLSTCRQTQSVGQLYPMISHNIIFPCISWNLWRKRHLLSHDVLKNHWNSVYFWSIPLQPPWKARCLQLRGKDHRLRDGEFREEGHLLTSFHGWGHSFNELSFKETHLWMGYSIFINGISPLKGGELTQLVVVDEVDWPIL